MDAIDRLLKKWRNEGLSIQEPCSSADLRDFESSTGAHLPDDLRSFFLKVNGMDGLEMDAEGFQFQDLRSLSRGTEESMMEGETAVPSNFADYFLLADYMTRSWGYAICLGQQDNGHVLLVGCADRKAREIASSFSAFVELYLADAPTLYPYYWTG